MTSMLMSCSEVRVASETNKETFRQLEEVLPTASVNDTEQTKREIGVFRTLFFALCPDSVCGTP